MRAEGARLAVVVSAVLIGIGAPDAVARAATDEAPPILGADELGQRGWSGPSCQSMEGNDRCIFDRDDGAMLGFNAWPVRPIDDVSTLVDAVSKWTCTDAPPIDVGRRPLTSGCVIAQTSILPASVSLTFGNDEWVFSVILSPTGEPSPEDEAFLLQLRDRQLAAAGGEPDAPATSSSAGAPELDRYMPSDVPAALQPSGGIAIDYESMGSANAGGLSIPDDDLDFLRDRTDDRFRLWMQPDGYTLGVLITQYPYEVLAGLAFGSLDNGTFPEIESSARASIENVRVVTVPPTNRAGETMVVEGFRRGRLEFRVMVAGPDVATSEALAGMIASQVASKAPVYGATAPIHPPGTLVSLGQAAVATAIAGAVIMVLRRLLAGRARPAPPLSAPAPIITDVSVHAAALRRDGRRLAAIQLLACAVIVVALVADIGWFWLPFVAAGVLLGVVVTARARRRELAASAVSSWTLGSRRSVVYGAVGTVLLVVGVAVAVRAVKELVLLPSLNHLRWSESVGISPTQLTAVLACVGLACLVLAAVLLRTARAHARSTSRTARDARPPILYLRSFEDDTLSVPSIHSARRPFFELFGVRARDPFEEGIAWELATHGPVSAVGKPGRSVARLGATRELLDPATWQVHVTERMDAAGWIVVAVGATDGLSWELGELTRRGHLAKCEFIVPPVESGEQARRWHMTRQAIDEAAGRMFVDPVEITGTFTLRIDPLSGAVSATRADKLDEAGYRSSIEAAFETRLVRGAADRPDVQKLAVGSS